MNSDYNLLYDLIKRQATSDFVLIVFIGFICLIQIIQGKFFRDRNKQFSMKTLFVSVTTATALGISLTIFYCLMKFGWVINPDHHLLAGFIFNPYTAIFTQMLFVVSTVFCIFLFRIKSNLSWRDLGISSVEIRWQTMIKFILFGVIIIFAFNVLYFLTLKTVMVAGENNLSIKDNSLLFLKKLYSNQIFDIFYYTWPVFIIPLLEEVLFRGIIFSTIHEAFGIKMGLILQALIFTLYHKNIIMLLPFFVVGIVLGYLYYKSKSLYPSIITHSIINLLAALGKS